MIGIVLEDASSGIVDEDETSLPAHIGQGQGAHHVGPDGLHLVRFAPVHIRPPRHSSRVEHVGRLHLGYVRFQGRPVLEAAGAVSEVDALNLAEFAEKTANPAGATVDQELQWLVTGGAVSWEAHLLQARWDLRLL